MYLIFYISTLSKNRKVYSFFKACQAFGLSDSCVSLRAALSLTKIFGSTKDISAYIGPISFFKWG